MAEAVRLERQASPIWEGRGQEEAALVARLPPSRRLKSLAEDLESLMMYEGFLHLSTDDLARRLRCSKGTLYRLAPSREELYEFVIERWLARIRDAGWRAVAESEGWTAKLVGYLSTPIETLTREASFKFVSDVQNLPAGSRIWRSHQRQRMAGLEAIIDAGSQAGVFQAVHARLVAELMLTSVRRVIEPNFLASVGMSLTQAFQEWYRILEHGLVIPSENGGRARANGVVDHGTRRR